MSVSKNVNFMQSTDWAFSRLAEKYRVLSKKAHGANINAAEASNIIASMISTNDHVETNLPPNTDDGLVVKSKIPVFYTSNDKDLTLYNIYPHFFALMVNCNRLNMRISGMLSMLLYMFKDLLQDDLINEILDNGKYVVTTFNCEHLQDIFDAIDISSEGVYTKFRHLCGMDDRQPDRESFIIIPPDTPTNIAKLKNVCYDQQYTMVLISMYVLMMFEQVNDSNRIQRLTNRWRCFCVACGIPEKNSSGLDTSIFPNTSTCENIYIWASSQFHLRKRIFQFILRSVRQGGGDQWSPFCHTIAYLCKGTEMGIK